MLRSYNVYNTQQVIYRYNWRSISLWHGGPRAGWKTDRAAYQEATSLDLQHSPPGVIYSGRVWPDCWSINVTIMCPSSLPKRTCKELLCSCWLSLGFQNHLLGNSILVRWISSRLNNSTLQRQFVVVNNPLPNGRKGTALWLILGVYPYLRLLDFPGKLYC